jgi:hypothetical protein
MMSSDHTYNISPTMVGAVLAALQRPQFNGRYRPTEHCINLTSAI